MNDIKTDDAPKDLTLEYDLDAPPAKVWRAISIPAFRDKWLPHEALADAEPVSSTPGEEIRYKLRDDEPPFLESMVTFQVRPGGNGGTRLTIVQGLVDKRLKRFAAKAANSNTPYRMRAA